ncbi:MAG: prephenate dehydrogenase/arogenate dehydrogenase family protein, partial [Alphaproteobacteria bacterium]
FARAARRTNAARTIIACDSNGAARRKIRDLNLADVVIASAERLPQADLVLLATPLSAYESVLRAIAPRLASDTIVSDVGSVKAPVLQLAHLLPEPELFIPAHPVAGTERSGPEAGLVDLFVQRYCLLTPAPNSNRRALRRLMQLWRTLGARVEELSPEEHDRILSFTSHLPHAVAYALVLAAEAQAGEGQNIRAGDEARIVRYAAGGLRDFTRIAASNPIMWRDVFLANQEQLLARLDDYRSALDRLAQAVASEDGEALEAIFTATRSYRRSVERAGQAGSFDARELKVARSAKTARKR